MLDVLRDTHKVLSVDPVIYNMYIESAFKSKRPGINLEKQLEITAKITTDCYRREISTAKIAGKVEVLQSTVACVLIKIWF